MTIIINNINMIIWPYVLTYGLLAVGLYFTIKFKFIQFTHFKEMLNVLMSPVKEDNSGISPFQALSISLASRVGTGNIAGVAVALYLGGPGAIFWMWLVALLGMATAYSESTLAQLYKTKDKAGQSKGGPAFYIEKGLGLPWLAKVFTVLFLFMALVFSALQSNSIASAMTGAFGLPNLLSGIVIVLFVALIIYGGIQRIASVAERLVPFMAAAYLLLALFVITSNISEVPALLASIVSHAFGLNEAVAGTTGGVIAAMMNGVRRGLFSNEAGMGTAPHIAAIATPNPNHPSSQGFVQALSVFIDTIVICTATAVMILLSNALEPGSGITGIELTQKALTEHIGAAGAYFIAFCILLFAFTTILGIYSFIEISVSYLIDSKKVLSVFKLLFLGITFWGTLQTVSLVFNVADAFMGIIASINLVVIVLLSGTVKKLTLDYTGQRKKGNPKFDIQNYPELEGKIDHRVWGTSKD